MSAYVSVNANFSAVMHCGMAFGTKCNEVLLGILPGVAAEFSVVNFEVGHCAASLASPVVAA